MLNFKDVVSKSKTCFICYISFYLASCCKIVLYLLTLPGFTKLSLLFLCCLASCFTFGHQSQILV